MMEYFSKKLTAFSVILIFQTKLMGQPLSIVLRKITVADSNRNILQKFFGLSLFSCSAVVVDGMILLKVVGGLFQAKIMSRKVECSLDSRCSQREGVGRL